MSDDPKVSVVEHYAGERITVTALKPDEQPQADVLARLMNEAYQSLIDQGDEPTMIYCGTDFYRDMMRRSKHVNRMRDWCRCTSRKVRTWKGRRFSYMVPDTWMAERGE